MKNNVQEKDLKHLLFVTTKKIPKINTNPNCFKYFLPLIGMTERYEFIKQYFLENNIDITEYLSYRETIKNELNKEYESFDFKKKLATIKHRYTRGITYKKETAYDKTVVGIDIKSACYQLFHKLGYYKEPTWKEHLANFTDNVFILNHDTSFMYDCFNVDETVHPPFNFAFLDLMQTAIDVGLDEYMGNYNLVRFRTTTDALWYTSKNIDDVYNFKNEWPTGVSKNFGGVYFHHRIRDEKSISYVNEYGDKSTMLYCQNWGNEDIFPPQVYNMYYPQIRKILHGEYITEMDRHYINNITSPLVTMII